MRSGAISTKPTCRCITACLPLGEILLQKSKLAYLCLGRVSDPLLLASDEDGRP